MLSVLVADGSSQRRSLVIEALFPTFRVLAVADGRSALAILERGRVDVALISLDLASIRAIELAERLAGEGSLTPLVVLGRSEERLRLAARLPNVFLTLRTPFTPADVQWVIARTLGRRVTWHDERILEPA